MERSFWPPFCEWRQGAEDSFGMWKAGNHASLQEPSRSPTITNPSKPMATPTTLSYRFQSYIDREGFPKMKMFETEERLVRFLQKIHEAHLRDHRCCISPDDDHVTVWCRWKAVDPSDNYLSLIGGTDAVTVLDFEGVPDHEILDPRLSKEEKLRRYGRSHAKDVRLNLKHKFRGEYDQEDVSLFIEAFCDELSE